MATGCHGWATGRELEIVGGARKMPKIHDISWILNDVDRLGELEIA